MKKEEFIRVLQLESFQSKALFYGHPELVHTVNDSFTNMYFPIPNLSNDYKQVFTSDYGKTHFKSFEFDKILEKDKWLQNLKYDNYRLNFEGLHELYIPYRERHSTFNFYFIGLGDLQSYRSLIDEIYQTYLEKLKEDFDIFFERYESKTIIYITSKKGLKRTTIHVYHQFAKSEKHLLHSLPRHKQIIFDGKIFKWTSFTDFVFKNGSYVCSTLDNFKSCFELSALNFVLLAVKPEIVKLEFDYVEIEPKIGHHKIGLETKNSDRLSLCFLEDIPEELYDKYQVALNHIYSYLNKGTYCISTKSPKLEELPSDNFQIYYRNVFKKLSLHLSDVELVNKEDFKIIFAEQTKEIWNELFMGDKGKIEKLADQRGKTLVKEIYETYEKIFNTTLKEIKPKLIFSVNGVYKNMYNGFHCTIDWPTKVQIIISQKRKDSIFGLLSKDLLKLIFFWLDALELEII